MKWEPIINKFKCELMVSSTNFRQLNFIILSKMIFNVLVYQFFVVILSGDIYLTMSFVYEI